MGWRLPASGQPGEELLERVRDDVVVGPQSAALGVHDAGVASFPRWWESVG